MKKLLHILKFFSLSVFVLTTACSAAQQKFTIISSRANNYCNSTCTLFDVPDLNGNPTAIIFITPVEVNGINLNPHPICSYYNGSKWSVMNVDNSTMVPGSQFNVQYYPKPDDNHFVHVVTQENLIKTRSYLDHAGLNGNPGAQFQFFQSASPNVRGGGVNKSEISMQYDDAAAKWYITNINGKTLDVFTGYSISISSGTNATTTNSNSSAITSTTTNTSNLGSFTPGAKSDHSGQRVFITAVGKIQGQFSGENGTNRIEVPGYEMDLNTAREASSGMATGRRQYSPILFQKSSGAASIQFFKALINNEKLSSVIFEVYEPSATSGATVLSYKIVLTDASVSGFKQSFVEGQKGLVDFIKLVFVSINLTYMNGGVTASDTWVP